VTGRQLRWLIPAALFILFAIAGYAGWGLWDRLIHEVDTEMAVDVSGLSSLAHAGREAYERRCASCHGLLGRGGPAGPPLVHPVYRPAYHADVAFSLAVQRGVRAHHWRLGDMPPQADVSADEIAAITRYIRELQRAGGIK
jgi:mono/diheme cytochrome c family protein